MTSTVTKIAEKQWTFEGTDQTFTTKKDATAAEAEAMTEDTSKAVEDAMDEVLEASETEEVTPAPKKKKAKKPAATKDKQEPKQQEPEAETEQQEPEAVTYGGFKVADGINPEDIAAVEKEANESIQAIESKDDTLVEVYVGLGKALHSINDMFASTKDVGKFRKQHMPGTEEMDPSLRSCCTWLYKALYGVDPDTSDILEVLNLDTGKNDPVSALRDYKTKNPVVIKRHYNKAKKDREKVQAAEAEGITEEEYEEQLKEQAKKEKEEAEAAHTELMRQLEEQLTAYLMKKKSKQDIANEAVSLMLDAANKKPEEALEWLKSMT